MQEPSDWRRQGQESYLKGVTLVRQPYCQYAKNPDWDHDHCEFCNAKFMATKEHGVLHSGYSTEDQYRWICGACFEDFREEFEWKIASLKAPIEDV